MKSLFLIAETACSHDGSVKRLKNIINNVVKSDFDAIQFQIWKQENIIDPSHKDKNLLKKIQISYKDWIKIIKYTKKRSKIEIIACVYDLNAFNFCIKNGISRFKIHASDIGNENLIKEISKKAKRIDLSVGSTTISEIYRAIKWIGKKTNVWLMYGYQLFPTNPNRLNLSYMNFLKKKFKYPIGYQDHSNYDISGYTIPTTAVGLGIDIIEKHVTDFNNRNATDGESAIQISEYKIFTEKCRESKKSFGNNKFLNFNKDEIKYRKYSQKIIFFKNNIKKNSILTIDNLILLRSQKKGLRLDNLKSVLGKKLKKNVKKYSVLHFKDLI